MTDNNSQRQFLIGTFFLVLCTTTIVIIGLTNKKQAIDEMDTENECEKSIILFLVM